MLNQSGFSEIYEFNNRYWVIQKSYQRWPDKEGPTERVALAGDLPINCSAGQIGELCISALNNFNQMKPQFSPWQLKELRQLFCSWVGAKGWSSFYKNSRYVWVKHDGKMHSIDIIPVDNCSTSPVESAIIGKVRSVSSDVEITKIGQAIFEAFKYATSHPERKT